MVIIIIIQYSKLGKVNDSPYCKVKILNGEIQIYGDIVSCDDNLFDSGDLGYIDNDGYLFINGRKKEVLILSDGNKIYPREIENFLRDYESKIFLATVCLTQNEQSSKDCLTVFIAPRDMEISNILTYNYFETVIHRYNDMVPSYKRIEKLVLKDKRDNCFIYQNKFKFNLL